MVSTGALSSNLLEDIFGRWVNDATTPIETKRHTLKIGNQQATENAAWPVAKLHGQKKPKIRKALKHDLDIKVLKAAKENRSLVVRPNRQESSYS